MFSFKTLFFSFHSTNILGTRANRAICPSDKRLVQWTGQTSWSIFFLKPKDRWRFSFRGGGGLFKFFFISLGCTRFYFAPGFLFATTRRVYATAPHDATPAAPAAAQLERAESTGRTEKAWRLNKRKIQWFSSIGKTFFFSFSLGGVIQSTQYEKKRRGARSFWVFFISTTKRWEAIAPTK